MVVAAIDDDEIVRLSRQHHRLREPGEASPDNDDAMPGGRRLRGWHGLRGEGHRHDLHFALRTRWAASYSQRVPQRHDL